MDKRTKTYFLSDLHLGAAYLNRPHDRERMLARFLDGIAGDAARLYLVGDILDYWFEYRTVVPRGHVRFFGALAKLADTGVEIIWLIGNHDIWMFDYLRDELGVRVIDGSVETVIDGKRFPTVTVSANSSRVSASLDRCSATVSARNFMRPSIRDGLSGLPIAGVRVTAPMILVVNLSMAVSLKRL